MVRGTNWVGDAVMTMPALRELRRLLPDARITLVTRSSTKALFSESNYLDDIIVYDRGRGSTGSFFKQVRTWRKREFDLAVLFQNAFEAALIAYFARVPLRLGYSTQGRQLLLTHPVEIPAWHDQRHEAFYYLNIITQLEVQLLGSSARMEQTPVFGLTVSESRKENARELLNSRGMSSARKLVALCPGSTNSRAKRWPAERYAELANKLVDLMGVDIVLIGSPDEISVSARVSELMHSMPIMLTGRTNLDQVIAVLNIADLLITNDTGPAHISAALNRPTIAIFGPTNPETTYPLSPVAEVIRHPPECAPCMLRDCPIDHRCMTAISPEDVFIRARVLLDSRQEVQL